MPGFCFSPTLINQNVCLILKENGVKISGIAIEANPAEIVLKHPEKENLIRINRDEIQAFTSFDEKKRNPDPIRLSVTRCYNMMTRCNGVKKISIDPQTKEKFKNCPAYNEDCETISKNFFDLNKNSQAKLLDGIQIGEFPKKESGDKNEKEK